jgi:hypothetical protein
MFNTFMSIYFSSDLTTPEEFRRITPAKENSKRLTGIHKNFEHDGAPSKLGECS